MITNMTSSTSWHSQESDCPVVMLLATIKNSGSYQDDYNAQLLCRHLAQVEDLYTRTISEIRTLPGSNMDTLHNSKCYMKTN